MTTIRTRFAPSPTGYLHIGGARTALFSYLYARRHGGKFVLRVEDTDRERSTEASVQAILDGLEWLGIEWDEGPFFQSQRGPIYQECLERLEESGSIYRSHATPDEIAAEREQARAEGRRPDYAQWRTPRSDVPATLWFRTPTSGRTEIEDAIKGTVSFANEEIDDFLVARSDGTPTYNFVVVVDDAEMAISHVIRGEDHLNNTPKQVLIYEALGAPLPRFAHVPLILGLDRSRLSKRHGATSVTAYRDLGYLPDALVNYLARLGWSHGDQELFSRTELVELFSLEKVGVAAGVFNPEKLDWVNAQYLKSVPPKDLVPLLRRAIGERGWDAERPDAWFERLVVAFRERAKTLVELLDQAAFLFVSAVERDPKAAAKFLTPAIRSVLVDFEQRLTALESWDAAAIEAQFAATLAVHELKMGKLAQPVRVALTGGTVSPGIHETIDLLGREAALPRLRAAIESISG